MQLRSSATEMIQKKKEVVNMRLMEMTKKPTKFGKATVEYGRSFGRIGREGNTICVPHDNFTEVFCLSNQGRNDQFIMNRGGGEYWFGGTDENPFLVQLTAEPFKEFLKLGEAGFYWSLVPKDLPGLCSHAHRRYIRQGDIFAVPLNMSWSTLSRCLDIARWGDGREHHVDGRLQLPLFQTRHMLTGREFVSTLKYIYGIRVPVVASGRVEAPDHTPLNLGDKPHALFQTANLADPKKAD